MSKFVVTWCHSCLIHHSSLLTDPKARKVILVEHPLLPLYIKDMIAGILFENMVDILSTEFTVTFNPPSKVPSVSFASSHLLSLLSVGRITGLVLDCGHLESVAIPVCIVFPSFFSCCCAQVRPLGRLLLLDRYILICGPPR
jgi:actin-related protein 10